ncbi:MAG: DivIVA domain-containing protein [Lachnospiraceae bacterium]|nr:DivIVA domain-containing protein [Lachnospiraceae bacterium]
MLSADDILDKRFEKGRGYDKKEVDDFMQSVYDSYLELQKKNVESEDKIRSLSSVIEHYKAIEDSLQKALILAEKTADETIQTARLKAESIIREANNKADGIIREAEIKAESFAQDSHSELEAVHSKTIGLMQEYVRYKSQFNKLIQDQIELLNGSRFDIQNNDLLAFKKMSETIADEEYADTIPLPDVTAEEAKSTFSSVNFGDIEETDTNYESAIPEKPDSVEVFRGIKADDEINKLDYLNAAERLNEEAFKKSDDDK